MTSLAPSPTAPPAPAGVGALRRIAGVQRRVPVLQVLVLVALVLYVGARDGDFTWGDLWAPILLQASFLGIAAAGQTLAILVGGLDFSIAAYIVAGNLLTTHLTGLEHWNFALVALMVLAICLVGGGLSRYVCHRCRHGRRPVARRRLGLPGVAHRAGVEGLRPAAAADHRRLDHPRGHHHGDPR